MLLLYFGWILQPEGDNEQQEEVLPLIPSYSCKSVKQKGVSETVIAEILDHKNENVTTERYGESYNVKLLENAICEIEYE